MMCVVASSEIHHKDATALTGIMMSFEDTIAAVLDGRLAPLRLEVQRLAAEVSDLRQALPPLLVSVPIAAERLGVSLSTARRRVRDGEWPVRRDGRRVLVDLERSTPKRTRNCRMC